MFGVALVAFVAAADTVRLCAGGDVTLGTNLDSAWAARVTAGAVDPAAALQPPNTLVAPLRALVDGADVVLLNAEGAIGDGPDVIAKCVVGHRYCYLLRMPAAAAAAFRTLADSPAVVVANLGNNHAMDAGEAGRRTTVALLDSVGVRVTGVDTLATLIPFGADTMAVLGFSAWAVPDVGDLAAVRRIVGAAALRYRWVVVTAHLGAEGRRAQHVGDSVEHFAGERRGDPVAFAHAAVESGAWLVIGHGPHVLRGVEWWHGAPIFYSLGNLVNYGPFDLAGPMQRGAILCVTLDSAGVRDAVLHPTRQQLPGAVREDTAKVALHLMAALSRADFPTTGASIDRTTGRVSPPRTRTKTRGESAAPMGPPAALVPPASPSNPPPA